MTRVRVDLSYDWAFAKRNPGRRWLRDGSEPADGIVDLPHSWNAQDAFQMDVPYYRGYGAYRKVFQMPVDVPAADYLWFIRSEGFYGTGDVWLNGRKLASVDGQYLGLCLEAGRYLPFDAPSVLGIRLTNRYSSRVLPGIKDPDFLLYGGLAGRVWIEGIPKLRVNRPETRIVSSCHGSGAADVMIHFSTANNGTRDRKGSVTWTIEDSDGEIVSASEPMAAGLRAQSEPGSAFVNLRVASPRLWSPSSPVLYRARCRLMAEDGVADEVVERFGIRHAEFRPREGFFLNGERLELRGCNRHESIPGFGNGLPPKLHREDAVVMKDLGLNFVRLSHCPQQPAFLDACDELGILVYAEIASWKSVRGGRWLRAARRQMREMIVRDRNRPSIILWGMGNESRSRRAYQKLRELALDVDPGRPVIYAENHHYRAVRARTLGIPDVWGLNYEWDALGAGCEASALKNVVVSECSNCPPAVRGNLDREVEQVALIEDDLEKMKGKPEVAGFALWSFNDYATLRKGRYLRCCGLVDAWRVPKMSAALLKAKYTTDPFVTVFGHWGTCPGPETGSRTLHIFTNCDEIVLRVNGREVAAQTGAPHVVQTLAFEPGILSVTGKKGGLDAVYESVSFSDAARLVLSPEQAEGDVEHRETVGVIVRVTDAAGHVVTTWRGKARVSVEGVAFARTYREDNAVEIAGGVGRFFITGNGQSGTATVRASCEDLDPARARVTFR